MIKFSSFFHEEVHGYYAIELDPSSHIEMSKHGQHEEIKSHHVTIAYQPSDRIAGILDSMLGRTFTIRTVLYVSNDEIDAVIVDIDGLKRQDPGPAHITISHKKGVMSAQANDMIQNPDFKEKLNLKLRGKLRFYPNR